MTEFGMAYDRLKGLHLLVVDDDRPFCEYLRLNLESVGCDVVAVNDIRSAEAAVDSALVPFDVALVDLYLPEDIATPYDRVMRGEQLAYTLGKRTPQTRVIGMSENVERLPFTPVKATFSGFIFKPDLPNGELPVILFETVEGIVTAEGTRTPRIFIVHGHDSAALFALKNYLQNSLRLGEPVVLRERPSLGRSIIEKFEHEVRAVDLVFVLLTPDDLTMTGSGEKRRARQNVVFELGFFYGKLQRTTGRVFLLVAGPLELPSDIFGVIYIDISGGVESAGEEIRRELRAIGWLR